MSQTATATAGTAPTAIEPSRVLELNDDEQHILLHALDHLATEREKERLADAHLVTRFRDRVAHGDEYTDTLDEFVRRTNLKRRLDTELRKEKERLAALQALLLDEFAEQGVSGIRHAATGRLVSITRKIWARARDGQKHRAAELMRQREDLGSFVELGFNTNSLSAYFRELATERIAAGDPVTDLTTLVPAELHDVLELTEDHTLSVRS